MALIVVHLVRKSVGHDEIGSAIRGSSALHAFGDIYLLLPQADGQIPPTALSGSCFARGSGRRKLCPVGRGLGDGSVAQKRTSARSLARLIIRRGFRLYLG